MMASLRHPSIVMYLGVCLDPPAVVTEYCARGEPHAAAAAAAAVGAVGCWGDHDGLGLPCLVARWWSY